MSRGSILFSWRRIWDIERHWLPTGWTPLFESNRMKVQSSPLVQSLSEGLRCLSHNVFWSQPKDGVFAKRH